MACVAQSGQDAGEIAGAFGQKKAQEVQGAPAVEDREFHAADDRDPGFPAGGHGLGQAVHGVVVGYGHGGQTGAGGQENQFAGGQGAVQAVEWVCRSMPGICGC